MLGNNTPMTANTPDGGPIEATQDSLFDLDSTPVDTQTDEPGSEPQMVFVRLRPGPEAQFNKCLYDLGKMREEHPGANVGFAGYAYNGTEHLLTLGINFGPKNLVAKFSQYAVDGFNFVNALFVDMHEFLPQYANEPSATEVAAAQHKALHTIKVAPVRATTGLVAAAI